MFYVGDLHLFLFLKFNIRSFNLLVGFTTIMKCYLGWRFESHQPHF